MRIFERLLPTILLFMTLIVAGFSVYTASQRALSNLEGALLQGFTLIFGLAGSFLFGKQSAKNAAREIIKPHARSAFRRLMSLYESLSRVGSEVQNYRNSGGDENGEINIAKLEAIVIEQLATADDALEDWRDIVPDDVEELRSKLETPRKNEVKK